MVSPDLRYSMLHEIDRDKKCVISIEAPIEFDLEGVSCRFPLCDVCRRGSGRPSIAWRAGVDAQSGTAYDVPVMPGYGTALQGHLPCQPRLNLPIS